MHGLAIFHHTAWDLLAVSIEHVGCRHEQIMQGMRIAGVLVDFSDQIIKIYHQGASMAQLTFEQPYLSARSCGWPLGFPDDPLLPCGGAGSFWGSRSSGVLPWSSEALPWSSEVLSLLFTWSSFTFALLITSLILSLTPSLTAPLILSLTPSLTAPLILSLTP